MDEKENLNPLCEQLGTDANIYDRKNFVGHITASGLILSPDKSKILLIKHKILDKFFQPGGHVDNQEMPLEAAIREIREETGLCDLEYITLDPTSPNTPLDIDTHYIPANPKKNEDGHYHYDFRYCFVAKNIEELKLQLEEVTEMKWVYINDGLYLENLSKSLQKVNSFIQNNKPSRFFAEIISEFPKKQVSTIIVTHLLPDRPFLLESLNDFTDLISVIPKPKSIDKNVVLKIENSYQIDYLKREEILDSIDKILKRTDKKIVILDIGGYFSHVANEIFDKYPNKILGIVEDTENGHQKYENLKNLPFPVVSVARSQLKENEDFLIGQSIVFSTDSILRSYNKLVSFMKCGIIGYGKIGKAIATCLQSKNLQPYLYDIDPIKMVSAINDSNKSVEKNELLEFCDVIFCASGSQSLNIQDFRKIKNGAFIVSVTSSEDEFNLSFLKNEYKTKQTAEHITQYIGKYNNFYMINNGNAVNFIHKASVGDFIFLVQAEILEATKYLLYNQNLTPKIYQLELATRRKIANSWLKYFN